MTVIIYNLVLDISDLHKQDAHNCHLLGRRLEKNNHINLMENICLLVIISILVQLVGLPAVCQL